MPVEEPVIVSGGSVTIQFSSAFKEQPGIPEQRYFTNDAARLVRVSINGQQVAELGERDRIEITYES